MNVKHEFLELHRKVILADSLCDFYDLFRSELPTVLEAKLKSFKTTHRKKVDAGNPSKLEPDQQKAFARAHRGIEIAGKDTWELVCKMYLHRQLSPIWNGTSDRLGIVEVKIRDNDKSEFLSTTPAWDDVVRIMCNRQDFC